MGCPPQRASKDGRAPHHDERGEGLIRHTGESRYPVQQTPCMPRLDSGFRRMTYDPRLPHGFGTSPPPGARRRADLPTRGRLKRIPLCPRGRAREVRAGCEL